MKHRFSALLLFTLFTTVRSKNEFPNEIVVTSADVVNGEIKAFGTTGRPYRLYAVYAIGAEEAPAKQVMIIDSTGQTFKLNELCNTGSRFLSENNIVVGPLTVRDPTPENQLRKKRSVHTRFAYTIYLVSTNVPALPVVDVIDSVAHMFLESDDYNGKETRGLTILSADARFSLRMFNFTADSVYIIPRGFDVQSSSVKDSIMDLNQQNAYSSYVTIFGPIVTVLNTDQTRTGRFRIGFDPVSWEGPLDPGSSPTLLSPNWLSLDESYSTSYQSYSEAFDRKFDYGKDTHLNFTLSVSSLTAGESVTLLMNNQKGAQTSWKYDATAKGQIYDSSFGSSLHLITTVASPATPSTYPRFMIQITSSDQTPPNSMTSSTTKMESTTSGGEGATMVICSLILALTMLAF